VSSSSRSSVRPMVKLRYRPFGVSPRPYARCLIRPPDPCLRFRLSLRAEDPLPQTQTSTLAWIGAPQTRQNCMVGLRVQPFPYSVFKDRTMPGPMRRLPHILPESRRAGRMPRRRNAPLGRCRISWTHANCVILTLTSFARAMRADPIYSTGHASLWGRGMALEAFRINSLQAAVIPGILHSRHGGRLASGWGQTMRKGQ
jgi:hypothetical protein